MMKIWLIALLIVLTFIAVDITVGRACRVTVVESLSGRFQPKEHAVLVLG
jgi:hypothetical protein